MKTRCKEQKATQEGRMTSKSVCTFGIITLLKQLWTKRQKGTKTKLYGKLVAKRYPQRCKHSASRFTTELDTVIVLACIIHLI